MGRYLKKKLIVFLVLTVVAYIILVTIKHYELFAIYLSNCFSWLCEDSLYLLGFIFGGLFLFMVSVLFDFYLGLKKKSKTKIEKKNRKPIE